MTTTTIPDDLEKIDIVEFTIGGQIVMTYYAEREPGEEPYKPTRKEWPVKSLEEAEVIKLELERIA